MLPSNWAFKEIIQDNKPCLVLEYCGPNLYYQYTFQKLKECKIGDHATNKKTGTKCIIININAEKIIGKIGRFEIELDIDEFFTEWEKN